MSTNILFVFEGERTEKQIVDSLQRFFVNENAIITCAYCGEIYQIYNEISVDEDLDTFNLLKERKQNIDLLKGYNRNDFAEIYLFFDYEGQSPKADDDKLKELLAFFDEETDKGKLYISYPMVESLKHISDYDTFKDSKVECKENINYKNIVSEECLNDLSGFKKYQFDTWKLLLKTHLKRMNYIVNDSYEFSQSIISQSDIFAKQLEKYIRIDSTVGVLNAFPIFVHDYYGNEETKKRIKHAN